MDPRYERFIKKTPEKGKKERGQPAPETGQLWDDPQGEPASLYQIQRTCGNAKWLEQNHPAARASFNVFNRALHPERPLATGLAVIPVKGTSFPDKRLACVAAAEALISGDGSGEVDLVPEPDNPADPGALSVIETATGKKLGYVPRASGANQTYAAAITAGRLCGAYIIEAKRTTFKGEPNAMLLLATGWKDS